MATQMRASTQVNFDAAVTYAADPGITTESDSKTILDKSFLDGGTWKYLIQDVLSGDIGSGTPAGGATLTPNDAALAGTTAKELSDAFGFDGTAGALATGTSGYPVLLEEASVDAAPSNHGFNTDADAAGEWFHADTVPGEYRIEVLDADGDEIVDTDNSERRVWAVWTVSTARNTTEAGYELRFFSGEWNGSTMQAYTMPAAAFKLLFPQIVAITALSKASLRTGQANISAEAAAIAAGQIDQTALAASVAGAGLTGGAGSALAVVNATNGGLTINANDIQLNIADLAAAAVDVAADSIAINDATDGSTKLEAIADLVSAYAGAGLAATNGVLAVVNATNGGLTINANDAQVNLTDLAAAVVDMANDSIAIVDATDSGSKKESIADFASGLAGAGIAAAAGVLAVANATNGGILVNANDMAIDFSDLAAAAVDVSMDSLPFLDATGSVSRLESIADLATAMAGSGISATNGVLAADSSEAATAVFDPGIDWVKFLDGGVAGTDAKDAWSDVADLIAGDGLAAASGVLALDLNELTAAVVDVSADSVAIIDATDDSSKKEAIADIITAVAGAGLTDAAGVMAVGAGNGVTVNANDVAINFAKDDFAGDTDGIEDEFTLSNTPVSDAMLMVFLNGQLQRLTADYTRAGAVVTMTSVPASDDDLTVTYLY